MEWNRHTYVDSANLYFAGNQNKNYVKKMTF